MEDKGDCSIVHRQLNFIWPLLLTVTSFALNTTVVKHSGTIVVFGLSKNKIVVAADSRGTGDFGETNDHLCKIIALSDKFVFASNGMADFSMEAVSPSSKRIVIMDASKEAKLAFESVPPGSDDFLAKVAVLWGRHVSSILNSAIATYGPTPVFGSRSDNPITQGYFFGKFLTGGLTFYLENIARQGNSVSFDSVPEALPLSDTIIYGGNGVTNTVDELREGKTERAKRDAAQRELLIFPIDDWDVRKAVRWVQLTLDDHPGKDSPVGGPIDSLTFTPVGGVRWYEQKKECQDQH
jgi:hypothetical protein